MRHTAGLTNLRARGKFAFFAVITVQLFSSLSAFARHSVEQIQKAQPRPSLTVLVYNYSELAQLRLSAAQADAERTFERAGIGLHWVACPVRGSDLDPAGLCHGEPLDPASVVVRIITAARDAGGGARPILGTSIVTAAGPSYYSTIYYGSIRQVCLLNGLYEEPLVAATMTHELGHLLLGSATHAGQGIMLGRWNGPDYDRISRGKLTFSSCQAKAIRDEVELRSAQSADCQTRLAQSNLPPPVHPCAASVTARSIGDQKGG